MSPLIFASTSRHIQSSPGLLTSLFYNEFEIGTYERYEDYDSVKLYSQAFWVSVDGGDMLINLYSLDEVKLFCDAYPGSEKSPEELAQALHLEFEF